MSVITDLIEGRKELNDALREEFMPENSRIEFLKPKENAREFETVLTFYYGWFLKYNKYRQETEVELATDEVFEKEQLRTATHLKINEDVYVITQGETIEPQGVKPYWTFYCVRDFKKTQFSALY
jgi:hypothetical protein